jgi:hypothetical protein
MKDQQQRGHITVSVKGNPLLIFYMSEIPKDGALEEEIEVLKQFKTAYDAKRKVCG